MKRFLISVLAILIWPLDANANVNEKFGSSFEAWQACEQFAEKYSERKGVYVGCEEDIPTNQILALDEDTLKVIKVFKF